MVDAPFRRELAAPRMETGMTETAPFRDTNLPVADRVADLLSRLTMEEKVGQQVMANRPVERPGIGGYHRWSEVLRHHFDAVADLGKPVLLLLSSGSAPAFDAERANAILQPWYYGAQGGRAIADAILGALGPAGRLPITFYGSDDDLPPFKAYAMAGRTYRYFDGKPFYASDRLESLAAIPPGEPT